MNELKRTKFILLKNLRAKIKLNLRNSANIHTELEMCVVGKQALCSAGNSAFPSLLLFDVINSLQTLQTSKSRQGTIYTLVITVILRLPCVIEIRLFLLANNESNSVRCALQTSTLCFNHI